MKLYSPPILQPTLRLKHYLELESQFRCNGSDGYLAWLDNKLGIREKANLNISELNYQLEVADDPNVLRDRIVEYNSVRNRAHGGGLLLAMEFEEGQEGHGHCFSGI
jgi:hypothetical protein